MSHRSRALTVIRTAVRLRLLAKASAFDRQAIDEVDGVDLAASLLPPCNGPVAPDEFFNVPSTAANDAELGLPVSIKPCPSLPASLKLCPSLRDRETDLPWYIKDMHAAWQLVSCSWINWLLVFVPIGIASNVLGWGAVPTFSLNILALIPLALLLGNVTEDLALRFGETIGGLINASFGNAVEIIISISALQRDLYGVVAMSLLGSVLSNLLLVLGCCMLFGGAYYKTQAFNEVGNRTCSALLFLSAISLLLPTAAEHLIDKDTLSDPGIFILYSSRVTAVVMLLCYGFYLFFQLHSHKEMFCGEHEDNDEPVMSITMAFAVLTMITILVAISSEALTGSIEEVTTSTGIGQAFLGIIVLPIAGNACEHVTAVVVAMKNKMDLALGVAVGSSIQISFFAIPLCVLVGWATGHNFTLSFDPFSALALTLSVVQVNFITSDAMSHWLMGIQLLAVYVLIGAVYFFR